ncbi:hypothetical protein MHB65_19935 [Lysinibacillus sp. FSL K6-0075]|uniref:hypothetical protein n=1 Tax=Lysinibacillus sp. FSL K6-0075 TaxID=2921415 RepID=UPI0031586C42
MKKFDLERTLLEIDFFFLNKGISKQEWQNSYSFAECFEFLVLEERQQLNININNFVNSLTAIQGFSKEGGKAINERMKAYQKHSKLFDFETEEVLPSMTLEEQYDDVQNFLLSLKR